MFHQKTPLFAHAARSGRHGVYNYLTIADCVQFSNEGYGIALARALQAEAAASSACEDLVLYYRGGQDISNGS